MSTHTPGPWFVKFCGNEETGSACRISPDPTCTNSYEGVVYDTNHDECGHMMDINDARLIAQAPDMFDFIETLENDNGQIPEWLWNKRNEILVKIAGRQ